MIPATAPSLSGTTPQECPATACDHPNRILEIAVSILIGIGFFLLLRASPNIPAATDGYRHVKEAWRLIHEPKAALADPWRLAYLWPRPVDAWFGFHVLLVPFAYLFELITAIKLFASITFGLTAYVIFLLLGHLRARYKTFWVLLALTGSCVTLLEPPASARICCPFC